MRIELAPIILANASYYGTLAAVRSLGRAGVEVVTVDPSMVCRGRYSRYASQHLACPAFEKTNALAEWLLQLGRTGPRRAIYATSDAVSFALALYRDELSGAFDLYQPGLDTIMSILDKGQLLENAQAIGMDTPATWFPQTGDEAAKIAKDVGGKFLIKPRSQLAQRTKTKGCVVDARADNVKLFFEGYLKDQATESEFAKQNPNSMTPIIQRYYPQVIEAVYSLSGFREKSGGRVIMRGARKVLQQPRQAGIGLCFETAPVLPALAERTVQLCERIGYHGVFELEFILADETAMLIDFNGRFYSQIAFDMARGMDLPGLAYAAATGNQAEVDLLMTRGSLEGNERVVGFCNRFDLATMLRMQRMLGTMSSQEATRWRDWSRGTCGKIIDAVEDPKDSLPSLVGIVDHFLHAVRHPRSFISQYGLMQ